MPKKGSYIGPVVYQDGWHYGVDDNGVPMERLYLEDDGDYRLAVDGDLSWHERTHKQFAPVELS